MNVKDSAEQAGMQNTLGCFWQCGDSELERFAELVRADEREACAKTVDGLTGRSYEFDMGRLHSAAAIRARGNE
jgi:hypothetical protein